jgi:hypothetical protein
MELLQTITNINIILCLFIWIRGSRLVIYLVPVENKANRPAAVPIDSK